MSSLLLENARVEAWALGIVARVKAGQPVEDSRVELKSTWPPPDKAARRIAAHANASLGAAALWIIGLDESKGVIGVDHLELADWWARVNSEFDGVSPSMRDLLLVEDSKTLCALLFDTGRAPFVVRNSVRNVPGAGPVEREVPWREGTAIRSATRNDLLRILVPAALVPDVECLDGSAALYEYWATGGDQYWRLEATVGVFITPQYDTARHEPADVVFPFHRCTASLLLDQAADLVQETSVALVVPLAAGRVSRRDSVTIEATSNECIVRGPGRCALCAEWTMRGDPVAVLAGVEFSIEFNLAVTRTIAPVKLKVRCQMERPQEDARAAWRVVPT